MTAEALRLASVTIGPRLAVELSLIEREGSAAVSMQVCTPREDGGTDIGLKSVEDYNSEVAEMDGKSFFEVVAACDGEQWRIRSAVVGPELRAGAVAEMFACLGSNLFTKFFAK